MYIVMKPQPDLSLLKDGVEIEWRFANATHLPLGPGHYILTDSDWLAYASPSGKMPIFGRKCPYGKTGDTLWMQGVFLEVQAVKVERINDIYVWRVEFKTPEVT